MAAKLAQGMGEVQIDLRPRLGDGRPQRGQLALYGLEVFNGEFLFNFVLHGHLSGSQPPQLYRKRPVLLQQPAGGAGRPAVDSEFGYCNILQS